MKKRNFTYWISLSMIGLMLFAGCSKKDDDGAPKTNDHIVGTAAVKYTESSETANNASSTAESTSYSLDTTGIVINGTFEAGTPTSDYYKFNTGTFTKVDVQVFVNGVKDTEESHKTSLSMGAAVYNGYSNLMGSGYFIRAWAESGKDWVIGVIPASTAAGLSYTMEIKGE